MQTPPDSPSSANDETPAADELATRLRQQQAVAEFGRFALSSPPLSELLAEAARHAAEGLGAPLSKVLEHLPNEDALLVRAGVGWREGVVGAARLRTDTASPAGFALRTGQPVVSDHGAGEARFRTPALVSEHGARRSVNVVVRGAGEPFGVLEADTRDTRDFSVYDVAFLQALAHTLGLAVDRERERTEREALLAEKELLVQEAHHRVKNGLQMVQSVLSLQARAEADPKVRGRLEQTAQRVRTIAAVHERLYRAADEAAGEGQAGLVEVSSYLELLTADLRAALAARSPGPGAGRKLLLEADAAAWPAAEVAALGLVLTELVTNAFKHGRGRVAVAFRHPSTGDSPATLAVGDEGPGPPEGFDPAAPTVGGLGMRLVMRLLRARRGRLEVVRGSGGTRFVAVFPGTHGRHRSPG
jgi:two-component sensor histidine kinase